MNKSSGLHSNFIVKLTSTFFEWSPPCNTILTSFPTYNLEIFIYSDILYLIFFLAYTLTFYLASILKKTGIHSHILSCILSGIFSGIPFEMFCRYSFWYSFWHLFWHSRWHSFWHSIWHSIWHSLWRLTEARQCPLRSGCSRLRPGSAHWDLLWYLARAVEVRQCPLRAGHWGQCPLLSAACGWGAEGEGWAKQKEEKEEKEEEEGRRRRRRRRRRRKQLWQNLDTLSCQVFLLPGASERRVLLKVEVCFTSSRVHIFTSSHVHILTSSHLHKLAPSHLLTFTSSYPHILASSHLHKLTSSHPHMCTSWHILSLFLSLSLSLSLSRSSPSHLHIFTSSFLHIFTSSHLHIFQSSHLHIFSFSHLLIFASSNLLFLSFSLSLSLLPSVTVSLLFLVSLQAAGSADEAPRYGHLFARNEVGVLMFFCEFGESGGNLFFSHETPLECQKLTVFLRVWLVWWQAFPVSRNTVRVSKTESFLQVWLARGRFFFFDETRFECQKRNSRFLSLPHETWLSVKNFCFFAIFTTSAATVSHEARLECQKRRVFCEFGWSGGNPFARNEVRLSKTDVFLWVWLFRR